MNTLNKIIQLKVCRLTKHLQRKRMMLMSQMCIVHYLETYCKDTCISQWVIILIITNQYFQRPGMLYIQR